jgi:hypothetical protein
MARTTLLALGVLLTSSIAMGTTNELTAELQRPKRLQIVMQAQAVGNLYKADTGDRETSTRISLAPSYKLGESYRLGASVSAIQQTEPVPKGEISNTRLTLTHMPVALGDDTILIPVAGLVAPTNEDDRRLNSFNGGLLLEGTAITNFELFGKNFAGVYGLALAKNFHTWDRTAMGAANVDYKADLYLGLEKSLTRKLTFLIDGDYVYANTYQNSPRTQFAIGQSLTWEENKYLSFTVGHSNGGDALKANGTDYDIRVFDGNTSVVYANIRAVY